MRAESTPRGGPTRENTALESLYCDVGCGAHAEVRKPSDDAIGSITLHTALVEKPRQVIELVSRPRVGVVLVTSVDVG